MSKGELGLALQLAFGRLPSEEEKLPEAMKALDKTVKGR